MSHFTVLVIGPDPEGQLAPYDENINVEPYKSYVDASHDTWPRYVAAKEGVDPADNAAIASWAKAHYGDDDEKFEVDDIGLYTWSTYNPKSQWDWYEIGGRWTGFFTLKPGASGSLGRPGLMTEAGKPGTADQAYRGAVDLEAMLAAHAAGACEQFDRYSAIVAQHAASTPFAVLLDQHDGDIEAARQAFWAQPLIQALSQANLNPTHEDHAAFYGPDRDEFMARQAKRCTCTYAIVAEGIWQAQGKMGWFGMSSDDRPDEDWHDFWFRMVEPLADDTLLTLVDCHI